MSNIAANAEKHQANVDLQITSLIPERGHGDKGLNRADPQGRSARYDDERKGGQSHASRPKPAINSVRQFPVTLSLLTR